MTDVLLSLSGVEEVNNNDEAEGKVNFIRFAELSSKNSDTFLQPSATVLWDEFGPLKTQFHLN